ncbi:hypothetical protein GCM10010340_36110 [Streptomyces griseoloalbus]|nr:hypothetical protein GCM10010340_36110 [Streptomyces albaduncus]
MGDMYDEARAAGLPWALSRPRPCGADRQARDYAEDALPQVLPLGLRDHLDQAAPFLSVTARRLEAALDSTRRCARTASPARPAPERPSTSPTRPRRDANSNASRRSPDAAAWNPDQSSRGGSDRHRTRI